MATFVLIHGACHGGWCWEKVVPLLEARGHTAYAPDLPGLGKDLTPPATVTLAALFPSLTYWLAVTKTYALCFLLVVTIVVLLLAGRPERNLPLVAVVAVVLGVTRTTGLAITALVVLAVLDRKSVV